MEIFIFIWIGCIAFLVIIAVLFYKTYEAPGVRAGKRGEKEAAEIIKQVLQKEDILLMNVCVKYKEKATELDNVIINRRGVFIIEVKNYSGTLTGKEDDYEWTKYKVSRGGNIYEKQVRNPIKQVRRQVYILARFLKYSGIRVWVEGYVLLLNNNSPVHNDMVLESFEGIDQALHGRTHNSLNSGAVAAIKELLQ